MCMMLDMNITNKQTRVINILVDVPKASNPTLLIFLTGKGNNKQDEDIRCRTSKRQMKMV